MEDFKSKVKKIVKNNFQVSVDLYFKFENKYNFFYNLSIELGKFLGVLSDNNVLDVGCGYGVSCKALKDYFKCEVIGVDLSDEMIKFGKKYCPDLNLIILDGENINSYFKNDKFDIVVFNASIFIFPDTLTTFENSFEILSSNGKIGFSHYPDIIDENGKSIFEFAFKEADLPFPKKKVISDLNLCIKNLEKAGFQHITKEKFYLPLDIQFLIDFFSIPAQSASLFPQLSYNERIVNIEKLFSKIKKFENKGKIVWDLIKGFK